MTETPSGLIPSEIASNRVVFSAVEHCARRCGADALDVVRLLHVGDRKAHSDLRYAIAKRLAEHLSGLGEPFRGVYVYGSLMSEAAGPGSDIDVIVVVNRRSDEVERLIMQVDLALTADYREVLGNVSVSSLLDAHIVDTAQERERRGYGALLRDRQAAPICLWRSDS